MDRDQEEIQFLGFFGILKESFNIVSSWRKIFTRITLALILPLSVLYLVQIQISELFLYKIIVEEDSLDQPPARTTSHGVISDVLSSEWTAIILFKLGYLIFLLILALLSTSAVVYTIACIYTAKDITFKKVMSVVPKVWKRLMITFIWNFIIIFTYHVVALLIVILGSVLLSPPVLAVSLLVVFLVVYVVGLLYINMVWQLATVVSVLEDSYGLNAMAKSRDLIKGKMGVSAAIFFLLGLCLAALELVFKIFVATAFELGMGYRLGLAMLCLIFLSIFMLFGLVIQTILYFVCKSYHHENIDKSTLADHLGGYLGEYVPLKSKDVQMEQFEV